jgi:hypothetical protein
MVDAVKTPRAGDTVKHGPTGETWLVAYVDGDRLAMCGWPFGEAKLSDCTLLKRASDVNHAAMLQRLADMQDKNDPRCIHARAALKARQP